MNIIIAISPTHPSAASKMTTEGSPRLPVIVVERPAGRSDQRPSREPDTHAVPRLSSLLGPASPRPGDVFRNKRGTMRPLGLLPDRRELDAWKELTMLLSKMPSDNMTKKSPAPAPPPTAEKPTTEQGNLDEQPTIEATVSRRPRQRVLPEGGLPSSFASNSKSAYRFSQRKRVEFDGGEGNRQLDDREYLETLAHAQSHMQRYYGQQGTYQPRPPRPGEVAGPPLPLQQSTVLKRTSAKQRR